MVDIVFMLESMTTMGRRKTIRGLTQGRIFYSTKRKKIKLSKKRKSRIVHSEHGEGPEEHDPDPSKKKRLTMDKGVVFCQSSQGPCISAETDYVEEEDSGHMTLEESSNHDLPKQD
ncbi:hypothetical protein AB205_0061030 [Aquarana catesbeiana]|uniref:Uncharacterized protein n=1 Tax=Aquarana catesbeiana TaxID=8400 RepID=A0A2G9QM99_AQUCT|nr:hypothetical protein AB205_0061030 [Aquarana catesbeiana]